jgi:acyl carrier protein
MSLDERIAEIVSTQLGTLPEQIVSEAAFVDDLGADSLDLVELVMAMEEAFDIEISDDDAAKLVTIGDAAAYLRARIEA